jgi:hypothetical protein
MAVVDWGSHVVTPLYILFLLCYLVVTRCDVAVGLHMHSLGGQH